MSRQFNFVKDAILKFDNQFVSDHNRSPLSITYDRIENKVRTQRGGLRIYHRADKRALSASWEGLPENENHTVDFGMGVHELRGFYETHKGGFPVTVTYNTGVTEVFTMAFAEFSMELLSRKDPVNRYTVSLTLEEV